MGGGEILRFQWAERAIAAVHVCTLYGSMAFPRQPTRQLLMHFASAAPIADNNSLMCRDMTMRMT
jgi:hypothetical protein